MKIISFANHKGGVGKTTSAANTAAALGERGARVLGVDLDPQGHLGEMYGIAPNGRPRLENVLLGQAPVEEAIVTVANNVDILPCSEELADALFPVAAEPDGPQRLGAALQDLSGYDYAVIDTPPGINFWSGVALLSSRWVVIPTLPEDLSVLSSGKIADFVDRYAHSANPDLALIGVVVIQAKPKWWKLMRDTSARIADDGLAELVRVYREEDAARTIRYGKPALWQQPDGREAAAYRRLGEIIERATNEER